MPTTSGDRRQHFPAIEKKHGGPISLWIERLNDLGDRSYADQIAFLRENHGFSQTHANALVMYVRGSTTSRRFDTPEQYFRSIDPGAATTARAIFAAIQSKFPKLELVIAWNQPMLRIRSSYAFGLSAAKKHLLLNPFSTDVLETFTPRLTAFEMNKKTFKVPIDWNVNAKLLQDMVRARLSELSTT